MKENIIEFYVNKFNFFKSCNDPDVSFLSPIVKRRLSKLDKGVIYLLNKTVDEETKNIIFSSQTGELERLLKLIEQYTTEKEVSPNIFSGSVHNYSVGFFLLNNKKPIPYSAISAGDNSISAGIMATVCDKFDCTTFCYCDICNNEILAFSVSVNKLKKGSKFKLVMNNNKNRNDSFENYVKLFSGELESLNFDIFSIERENNE